MFNTDTNKAPYFNDHDRDKKFVSLLFRPAPVQARELNQLQTIMQEQIAQVGSHLFTEGSMVVPGGVSVKLRHSYATFQITSATNIANLVDRDDLWIKSRDRNVRAKVSIVLAANAPSIVHQAFVDYTNSGEDGSVAFAANDPGFIFTSSGGVDTTIANVTIGSVGFASTVRVNEGVYFIRGAMIRNDSQQLVVTTDVPATDVRVGFNITERIVTSAEDASLNSNALGYPNFKAPGAHRLAVDLTLSEASVTQDVDNFIELVRIEDGGVSDVVETTNYSIIERAIANRTHEQAGDYTVDRHDCSVIDHDTDAAKLEVNVKPGVSYVRGYRVENQGPVKLDVDRARVTAVSNNAVTGATFGRYFNVSNVSGSAHLDVNTEVLILSAADAILARTRLVSAIPTSVPNASDSMRLYVSSFDASVMVDARKVRVETSGSVTTMTATIETGQNVIRDTNSPELLFNLPVTNVETLAPATGRDTTFTVMKSFLVTLDTNGAAQFSAGVNSIFEPHSDDTYFVGTFDASGSKILGGIDTTGGAPAGSLLSVNLPALASTQIVILAPVIKTDAQPRVKTALQHTVDVDFNGASRMALAHQDVFNIVSVTDLDANDNITSQFTLDTGQRDTAYEISAIDTASGLATQSRVRVVYDYFAHGIGDYFCVDSYASVSYDDIKSYTAVNGTTYDLRDTIDFRARVDVSGQVLDDHDVVRPTSVIRNDVEFYQPRIDAAYVDYNGSFGIIPGVPGSTNAVPEIPEMSMRLFNLRIPAYTPDPKGVVVEYIDNRRFTMRDIGKIEARVANLEYYSTLSQLESSAEAIQVFDEAGLPRFKNGIAADPFVDWRLTDLNSLDQSASIDPNNGGELRPEMMMQSLSASHKSSTAHHLAGVVTQINGPVAIADATQLSLPTTGTAVSRSQPYATRDINVNPYAVYTWQGFVSLKPTADVWKDVQYADPIMINNVDNRRGGRSQGTVWGSWQTNWFALRGTIAGQSRTGTTTTLTSWETSSSEDNSIGTEVIPFMRAVEINFVATNLKPHSQVHAFFDNVNVNGECTPTGKLKGEPIVTDASGSATGVFSVPNRDDMRFETGTSSFRLTDSPTDSRDADEYSTASETGFTSNGTLETRQVTVTRTRHLGFTQSVARDNRVVRRDPLAQTFAVSSDVGEIIQSVDVFFTTKSSDIPVTLEVRTVENGFPTNDVITRKTIQPADVVVSPMASVATKFIFDEFLFLESEREYAIVLLADTQDYNVGIAQMGETVMGDTFVISKQPTIGVFFTSQNGSTWSPHQNQDMKFTIHRYTFASDGEMIFDCDAPESRLLPTNPIAISLNTTTAQVNIPSHGLQVGHTFTIAGAVPSGGLDFSDINGVFTVGSVIDVDTVEIQLGSAATVNGITGGSFATYTGNVIMNAIHASFDTFMVDKTTVLWDYRVKDVSGTFGDWTAFVPDQTTAIGYDGTVRAAGDLQYRATLNSTRPHLSPVVNLDTHTGIALSPRIDVTANLFNYVTTDILLENQAETFQAYVGAKLPVDSGMRLYVQYITDDATVTRTWVEVLSDSGLINDSANFREYVFRAASNVTPFIGLKFKIELTGSRDEFPSLRDFRMIALV